MEAKMQNTAMRAVNLANDELPRDFSRVVLYAAIGKVYGSCLLVNVIVKKMLYPHRFVFHGPQVMAFKQLQLNFAGIIVSA